VTDLRLDGLSRPYIVNFRPQSIAPDPYLIRPAIVAELSTSRDLRELAARPGTGASVELVLCNGRSHITDGERRFGRLLAGDLRDELEFIDNQQPRSDWPQPIDGPYRYSVAIVLRQQGRESHTEGFVAYSLAEFDLMRNPVDLCLFLDSYGYGPLWRSNTVVIPAAAIRAAIDAARPPR